MKRRSFSKPTRQYLVICNVSKRNADWIRVHLFTGGIPLLERKDDSRKYGGETDEPPRRFYVLEPAKARISAHSRRSAAGIQKEVDIRKHAVIHVVAQANSPAVQGSCAVAPESSPRKPFCSSSAKIGRRRGLCTQCPLPSPPAMAADRSRKTPPQFPPDTTSRRANSRPSSEIR